jgi:hypothetical protein
MANQTNYARAKQLRINRQANAALTSMRCGRSLHLEFRETGPRWSLSDGQSVNRQAAKIVTANPAVIAENDSLFSGLSTSQTFFYRKGV